MDLEKTYQEKFGKEVGVRSLGWSNEHTQKIRFKVLMEISGLEITDSVLDVGCGHGDLSYHFDDYLGIDLRKSAIITARENYEDKWKGLFQGNFLNQSVFETEGEFDWCFASGVFALKNNWEETTQKTIEKMFCLCKKGIAFNLLSDSCENKDVDMKHCVIDDVSFLMQSVTDKYVIRNDYLSNDLTVYAYKS